MGSGVTRLRGDDHRRAEIRNEFDDRAMLAEHYFAAARAAARILRRACVSGRGDGLLPFFSAGRVFATPRQLAS